MMLALQLPPPELTGSGLTFMIVAWVCVSGLLAWCFWRVLGGPKSS